ncbi:MAG: sialidase family protein [Candidatus Acidiferrum sp.]
MYFISEASKVIDGEPHHKLGTTRIFVSSDGGQTWVESAQTGWADFSSSAVSNPRGSSIQRLYVLYNGHTKSDNEKGLGSTLDYFTVSEDGRNVSERQSVSGMAERNYQGVYPSSSVALSDGSVVALYDARTVSVEPSGTAGQEIGVVRFDNRGASRPIIVANPGIRNDLPICPESLSNSLAYDKAHDLLYLAYNDIVSGHCAIFIADSRDGGKTWSASREVSISEEAQTSKYFPILTANRDGLVGLLWRAKPEHSPDCWYFSISRDGLTFSQTTPLAPCVNIESLADQSSAYLSAIIRRPKANQPIALELLTFRDAVMRVGIAATADGVFHPFWTTLGDGSGELRTARILSDGKTRSIFNRPLRASELSDITDQVTLLYGGEQRLDRESQSVMVDISVRNDSGVSLLGPLVLKVEEGGSDFGKVELVKRDLRGILEDNYVDISSSVQGVSLDPGQTTSPYHLIFHFVEESTSHKHRNLILRVKFRILSGKWT